MSLKYTRAVSNAQGLTPKAKNLLRVLADRADRNGRSFARQERLAVDLGVSERTVRAAMKELALCGWIVRERRWRKDGTRMSDLVTVQDLKAAAKASEAMLQLPLMRVIEASAAAEAPVQKPVQKFGENTPARRATNRQILPVGQPANPAGYKEPITLTEDLNRSEAAASNVVPASRVAARVAGRRDARAAALALLDEIYGALDAPGADPRADRRKDGKEGAGR